MTLTSAGEDTRTWCSHLSTMRLANALSDDSAMKMTASCIMSATIRKKRFIFDSLYTSSRVSLMLNQPLVMSLKHVRMVFFKLAGQCSRKKGVTWPSFGELEGKKTELKHLVAFGAHLDEGLDHLVGGEDGTYASAHRPTGPTSGLDGVAAREAERSPRIWWRRADRPIPTNSHVGPATPLRQLHVRVAPAPPQRCRCVSPAR
eukprot:scaffold15484_cov30-Tisochrysis_lutea.AAC.2